MELERSTISRGIEVRVLKEENAELRLDWFDMKRTLTQKERESADLQRTITQLIETTTAERELLENRVQTLESAFQVAEEEIADLKETISLNYQASLGVSSCNNTP